MPIVSIILPTYNRLKLLSSAVESVYSQTLNDWELLIIDSESFDGTGDYCNNLSRNDSRIRYFNMKKSTISGISTYLNFGIENSLGNYIARLDDDDFWCDKNKLKLQSDFLDSAAEYAICGGGVVMIDGNGKEMFRFFKKENDAEIRKNALIACPFEHTTIMFRKDMALQAGCYRNYKVCEDWDFFLRLGLLGKFYNFQIYFTNYLQAGVNYSLQNQSEVALTELKIIREYRKKYPGFYKGTPVTFIQLLYSYFPSFIKTPMQYILRYIKRKYL